MKQKTVFDSNIPILWSQKKLDKNSFIRRFNGCRWLVSEITEIEILSSSNRISSEEKAALKEFLKNCKIIRLSRKIKAETIRLRSALRLKLPDSIIAATAVVSKATLISNDSHLSKALYPGLFVESFV